MFDNVQYLYLYFFFIDEILVASDELTRVVDLYKEVVLLKKFDKTVQKPYNISSSNGMIFYWFLYALNGYLFIMVF